MSASEWSIDTAARSDGAVLKGIFRLESPEAYDRAFSPMLEAMDGSPATEYTIDLTGVTLMNSSGIRALADLVLRIRDTDRRLRFIARAAVPWQAKTMASMRFLTDQLAIEVL